MSEKASEKGPGAPTKWKDEFCIQVEKLCKLGATDAEIADFFLIVESTLNEWKKKYPEFSESIKKGKLEADSHVAHSLYHRAIGYEHEDVDIRVVGKEIVETPLIKHYPPDSTAAIFWLKNRRPDKWRDRQEIDQKTEHSGEIVIKWQDPDVQHPEDKSSD